MHKYQSLTAWKRAHEAAVLVLRSTDQAYHPRSRSAFDQLRRATISIEANVVEGYALATPALFRRHIRIALGSAAEAECLTRMIQEMEYLPADTGRRLLDLFSEIIACLVGLFRKGLPFEKGSSR
ncbi:MAG TPA: four helix bundle protein [Gemmatimonadales bacterium]|nr:four helix bundle protein [Gemmatimonadales bacterium]